MELFHFCLFKELISPYGFADVARLPSYASTEMDGVYLTFYKNRVLYHMMLDVLTYAEGGHRSLQATIGAVRHDGLEMPGAPVASREG